MYAIPFVKLGTGVTAVSVDCGSQFTCAVLNDGSAKCWGYSGYAQLGDARYNMGSSSYPMAQVKPIFLGENRTAVSIAAGNLHTCAILDTGDLKCWGDNRYDMLSVIIIISGHI